MNRWTGADPAGLVDGPNVYIYSGNSANQRYDRNGDSWVAHYDPPGENPEAHIGFKLDENTCNKLCCVRVKLKQHVKSQANNPAWNLLNRGQTQWHLDGGEWYPHQSNSRCSARMDDAPKMPWGAWGGKQNFRVSAWCIKENGTKVQVGGVFLWHATTRWPSQVVSLGSGNV